jgi:hypothetical protein
MVTNAKKLDMRVLNELAADVNKDDSWFTPAFWTTVATALGNLVTVAVLVGWLDATNAADVSKAVVALVGAVQVIFVNTALVWKYVKGKQAVEVAKLQARTAYFSMLREGRG